MTAEIYSYDQAVIRREIMNLEESLAELRQAAQTFHDLGLVEGAALLIEKLAAISVTIEKMKQFEEEM